MALGPARFLDLPSVNLFATALLLAVDIYSFMTIAMCMVYHYYALKGGTISGGRIFAIIALLFLLPLSTGVSCCVLKDELEEPILAAAFDESVFSHPVPFLRTITSEHLRSSIATTRL